MSNLIQAKNQTIATNVKMPLLVKGRPQKKTGLSGNISQTRGVGGSDLNKSTCLCLFTKFFFACQNHPEVLKHVLQKWEIDI